MANKKKSVSNQLAAGEFPIYCRSIGSPYLCHVAINPTYDPLCTPKGSTGG